MSNQSDTLTQLNTARDELTTMIIGEAAARGTPEFQSMLAVVHRRDQITTQINTIIAAAFNEAAAGLSAAVAQLKARTADLQNVQKTLDRVNVVIQVVDGIVQAATVVVGIATA